MKNSVRIWFSAVALLAAWPDFAAAFERITSSLQHPEVQKLIRDQSLASRHLVSVKDLYVESVFRTGDPSSSEHVVELTFVSRPRAGGSTPPVVCQVGYSLDADSAEVEVPVIRCPSF